MGLNTLKASLSLAFWRKLRDHFCSRVFAASTAVRRRWSCGYLRDTLLYVLGVQELYYIDYQLYEIGMNLFLVSYMFVFVCSIRSWAGCSWLKIFVLNRFRFPGFVMRTQQWYQSSLRIHVWTWIYIRYKLKNSYVELEHRIKWVNH